MPHHRHRPPLGLPGFSLFELLVYIFIVALLAIVAVPLYKQHINRARLMEGLSLVESVKATLQERGLTRGFDTLRDNASAGIAPPESFAGESVESITVRPGGILDVAYHHPEGTLRFTPSETFGLLRWQCVSATPALNDILPPGCQPAEVSG